MAVPHTVLEEEASGNLRALCVQYPGAKVVRRNDLTDYADKLIEIRRTLDAYRYHAILVPFRGAIKPYVQLDVLAQHRDEFIALPFTGASQRENDERLRWYIREGIAPFKDEAELRLAVVDTGDGGNGSITIADLLKQCHADDKRRVWHVHIHLMFKAGKVPPLSWTLQKYSGDNFHVNPFQWPVKDLIVEDWDAALGMKAAWDDGTRAVIEETSTEGTVIVQDSYKLQVVHSPMVHHYMDSLLGEEVSDGVRTHRELPHFGGDVWQKYMTPGVGEKIV